ncbi:thermonuclease family protein [Yoonia sp. 208BN28-4]|uniref:thermonuclease family protein n=1 Tax=Yoonia sp. 208BN28-4 TaxID=3126505 RepID=UPI003097513A
MGRRRDQKVVPFSRDYRRTRPFDMGLPKRRKPRRDPKSYLKAVILVGAGALVALPALTDATVAVLRPLQSGDGTCRIAGVIDGDTVQLWCPSLGSQRARLLGFDAPELFSPQCTGEATQALAAKWYLRRVLFSADDLRLVKEGRDRYDRSLVRVFVDGVPLARQMIEEGHARPYEGGKRAGWC